MARTAKASVFLVHGQPVNQRVIAQWLWEGGFEVEQYLTAREFQIDQANHTDGGIVLVTVRLLGMSGIELAKELEVDPTYRVLLISGSTDVPLAIESGFNLICWPCEAEALIDELQFLMNGGRFEPRELAKSFSRMTPRELEIMPLISKGLSSRDIGEKLDVATKTIEALRAAIMAKSRARDVGQLVAMWQQWTRK